MRKLVITLILASVLTVATIAPAFAIVDNVTPICTGETASGEAAGGQSALGHVNNSDQGDQSPPMPARGEANSDDNSPAAGDPGSCPHHKMRVGSV